MHKACSAEHDGCCPRHIYFYCKRRNSKRPVKHKMPACTECSLKQNRMIDSDDPSRAMICWSLWPLTSEAEVATVVETQTNLERQLELIETHQREVLNYCIMASQLDQVSQ